ncbi:MAG: hypothetical protein M4D85_07905 [Actinomycetota bacterium]|nr:hypothetical protein [Actinomycetota bacterium]
MDGGHRYFEELAISHVLGGLHERESSIFRSHLLDCDDCRATVGELRALAHELADAERDERRVRAAQAIETKRRQDETRPAAPERTGTPLLPRLLLLGALLAFVALSVWNFALRGTVSRVRDEAERMVEAQAVSEFGREGTVQSRAPGVRGSVTVLDRDLVLLLDGLPDSRLYGVYLLGDDGSVLTESSRSQRPTGERLHLFFEFDPSTARRLVVSELAEGFASTPEGPYVFQATLPAGG